MADKNDVLKKMDREIADFFRSMGTKPDKAAVDKLQHYTLIRHELDSIPLHPPQIDAMFECAKLLQAADILYESHVKKNAFPSYNKLAYFFVDIVYRETRLNRLLDRMNRENEVYQGNLLKQPPEKIIESAAEIAVKNDILFLFENNEMSSEQIDTLLTFENPLKEIYNQWTDTETTYMDMLREVMEYLIDEQDGFLHDPHVNPDRPISKEDTQVFNIMYDAEYEDEEDSSDLNVGEADDEDLEQ